MMMIVSLKSVNSAPVVKKFNAIIPDFVAIGCTFAEFAIFVLHFKCKTLLDEF